MKWTDENQVKIGAVGEIEAVVKVINTHVGNADVCYHGCGGHSETCPIMAKALAEHNKQYKWIAENKAKAGIAGSIEAVVKAINTHIDSADVCEYGCGALRNMAVNGKSTS